MLSNHNLKYWYSQKWRRRWTTDGEDLLSNSVFSKNKQKSQLSNVEEYVSYFAWFSKGR
jgi:hypothetical protein